MIEAIDGSRPSDMPRDLRLMPFNDGTLTIKQRAFDSIVQELSPSILGYLRRNAVNDPVVDPEDILQETLLRVWQGLPNYREHARLSSWAFTIARNANIDEARKIERRPQSLREFDEEIDKPGERVDDIDRRQTAQGILGALGELEPRLRMPVLLKDIQGLTYQEITEVLGISVEKVKSRIYDGREKVIEAVGQTTVQRITLAA